MPDDRSIETPTLMVATFSSFMGPFMISAVNVALPAIQKEFSVSAVLLSWIATSYLLSTAVFLVPFGKLADIHGRKKTFAFGLMVFVLFSLLTAFSISVWMLIILRIFQGIGTAMIVTTGMAILTSVFPPNKRGSAIGIYVAAVYIGLSLGPFVGGALTHYFSWRSIFIAIVPFGLVSIYITLTYLKKEWVGERGGKFDTIGSILYGFALLTLIYGASLLPNKTAYFMMAAGVVGFIAFAKQEQRANSPVFELKLFRNNKLFAFSSLAALINYAATFAITFLLSLYLQFIKGMNPRSAGLILITQPIVMAVLSPLAGKWSDRIEPRIIASGGMAVTVLGLVQLIAIGETTSIAYLIAILSMLGFGFALFSSPNMNAVMSSVEKRHYGIASGAVATMRLLGQMFSMATATVVFTIIFGKLQITPLTYALFLKSFKIILFIFSLICTVGIFFSFSRGALRETSSISSKKV
ncbi:MAG: MFS transporter [Acidiferrobacteraceae bacterium]|jgi:EmrB/QacA subfamily drug resistance transporter|nr:MFS transporter [Acidiferrobacteraceae bacterium]MDP6735035.1 MFS transporter [Nitrospinaceae bacterium]|tara:strand:- start:12265 stop:13668 length:1404 start_codon:yes stop_codon:yes gene_type:complete